MDLTPSTAPKSDQQNFDDYVNGPRTVTITKVTAGSSEQPVHIHLAEFPGRPYKPSKSMRRVLIAGWGPQSTVYISRQMTLYGDPHVTFGGIEVGGIKISHMSDIDGAFEPFLTESKGHRALHKVHPLSKAHPLSEQEQEQSTRAPSAAEISACNDVATLSDMWRCSGAAGQALIKVRVAELDIAKETVDTATGEIMEDPNSQWNEAPR